MTPEGWAKIKEIFLEAAEMDAASRERFVAEKCGADAALRAEVEKMLAQMTDASGLMSRPVIEKTAAIQLANSIEESDPLIGASVGAYRLTGVIGRGGMGAVYAAERADGSFQRKVAVKLVKRGIETEFLLKRFRIERQLLAGLSHPNIARLYDGGTTEDGLPFFVMEYVEGEPLYLFCDSRKLSVKERLKIFLQVCEAVHAAHRMKIVHRDLKPSNILVKRDAVPKLLDFGIAKPLDAELADLTVERTATAMQMMTPEYASPEQIQGEEVTPASDVYSLGVILYELLSGHRPYRLKNRSLREIARVVCEQSPESLSDSLESREAMLEKGDADAALERILEARGATLAELRRTLAGDLERIVMKALRKRPADRYRTALEIAEDLRLYLASKPIKKQAPAQRSNRGAVEKPSLAVLPLKIIGSPQADEQYLSLGLADSLITRLSRVGRLSVRPTSSILGFAGADDHFRIGRELGVEYVVDGIIRFAGARIRVTVQLLSVGERSMHWSESYDERLTDVLAVEDSISERVINALVPQLTTTEKHKLARRETNSPEAYEAYLKGRFYWNQFTPEALPKALEAFQTAARLDPNYAQAYVGIADFYIWANIYGLIPSKPALAEAEKYARQAIASNPASAEAYATLSFVEQSRRQWAKAEESKLKAIELAPDYVHAREWYADQLIATGSTEAGISQTLAAERIAPLALRTKLMVSFALYQAHRFEESLERGRQILELDRNYPSGYSATGIALWALQRYPEALEQLLKFDALIPNSPYVKCQLCHALAKAGKPDEARKTLAEMKTLARESYVKPYFLAMAHVAAGETDEAFALFEQSFEEDDPWMLWFGVEPMLEDVRADARYADLLRRMNNPLAEKYSPAGSKEDQTGGEPQKSIAVLPLRVIRADGAAAGDDYLSVGLADAMITRLSNVRRLIVRPTSSILKFAGDADQFEAGRSLAVDYILSGTIRRAGERIRVSGQLLDVEAGETIWAENFDEDSTDVLEIEDLISERVTVLLIPKLTGDEQQLLKKRGTDSPAAFEAYLRGRYHLYQMTPGDFARARDFFEEAVRLDPGYALAYVGLAEYYFVVGAFAPVPPRETYGRMREMAQRALGIDASLGEAYAILGYSFFGDFDYEKVEANLRRGVELNPHHAPARVWLSMLLTYLKRSAEAVAEARRAVGINPLGAFEQIHLAWILYQNRRFAEALAAGRKAVADHPEYSHGLGVFSAILRNTGHEREAVAAARRAVLLSRGNAWQRCNLAASLAAAGEGDEARGILRDLEENSGDRYVLPARLATAYVKLGELERALDELEKAFAAADPLYVWISTDPGIDPLRADPRFIDLERRVRNYAKTHRGA